MQEEKTTPQVGDKVLISHRGNYYTPQLFEVLWTDKNNTCYTSKNGSRFINYGDHFIYTSPEGDMAVYISPNMVSITPAIMPVKVKKMLVVNSCEGCPFLDSEVNFFEQKPYFCREAGLSFQQEEKDKFPDFCPLKDYIEEQK